MDHSFPIRMSDHRYYVQGIGDFRLPYHRINQMARRRYWINRQRKNVHRSINNARETMK